MAEAEPAGRASHFWARHPKKTLAAVVGLAILALALIADRLIALKVKPQGPSLQRHIRLRELNPLTFEVLTPPPQVFDQEAGSQPRRVVIRVDENGFIMPSRIHPAAEVVLAFLGGSTTECRAVPEESRFVYLAGRRLEEALKLRVNSYNAARSGNNSLHSLNILLNKVMPLHPDVVVMMHNINDLITLMYEKTYWNANPNRRVIIVEQPTLSGQVRGFFRVLREYAIPNLYRAWQDVRQRARPGAPELDEFRHVRGKKIVIDGPYLKSEFRRNLSMFVNLCQARRITPALMTQANRFVEHLDPRAWQEVAALEAQGIAYQDFREIYRQFNQIIRDVGRERGVTVVDLERHIPQATTYVHDIVHFTEKGSKETARLISQELEPLVRARRQGTGQGPEP